MACTTLGVLLACFAAAPSAQAGWILTPFGGIVFGGDVNPGGEDFDLDLDTTHGVYGLDLGYMGDSALGFEIDFAYSPDFFGGDDSFVPDNNLVTLMGNLVLQAPLGESGRIYLSGGGGLIRSQVNDTNDFFDIDRNDFGIDAGAGLIIPLGSTVGLRGDIRYFRSFGDPEPDNEFDLEFGDFDFWRATGGLSINF
jgi:opacity protein-like surface antigen